MSQKVGILEGLLPVQDASVCKIELRDEAPPVNLRSRQLPATANPIAATRNVGEFRNDMQHHPDRGSGYYQYNRARNIRPSLVDTGRHAGRSRVKITGFQSRTLGYHIWKRDFFHSCINLRLPVALLMMTIVYGLSFFFWGIIWYSLFRFDDKCVSGFNTNLVTKNEFIAALLFSIETQQTIGFGSRFPNGCWSSTILLTGQAIWGQLLNALVMGVIFARISHPRQRSRTIFISDSAVIARRDGQLKLMIRVGDIRKSTVVNPKVYANIYFWGLQYVTHEGEHIPVRSELLNFHYPAKLDLLLPLVLEHNIDEQSPLFGLNYDTLMESGVEIVVTFTGTSEGGDLFMARQSYLPTEIHWGFQFTSIVKRAEANDTCHTIDFSRFHDIEPQEGLMIGPTSKLSKNVTSSIKGQIPWPSLTNNTLVMSDSLLLNSKNGKMSLQFRVGDTYPHNMLDVSIHMYFYKWNATKVQDNCQAYEISELTLMPQNPVLLRLPVVMHHLIDGSSPLAKWQIGQIGVAEDASSEIVILMRGIQYSTGHNILKQQVYKVAADVKFDKEFCSCVTVPKSSTDHKPLISWHLFHKIAPISTKAIANCQLGLSDDSLTSHKEKNVTATNSYDHQPLFTAAPMDLPLRSLPALSRTRRDLINESDDMDYSDVANVTALRSGSWKKRRSLFNLMVNNGWVICVNCKVNTYTVQEQDFEDNDN